MTDKNTAYRKKRKRRKKKGAKRQEILEASLIVSVAVLVVAILFFGIHTISKHIKGKGEESGSGTERTERQLYTPRPDLDVQLLTINEYSRPGIAVNEINGIVIHYTANPGTTAQQNRDYFEGLKDSHKTKVSSHFVIGLDGEIIQCIPTAEIAYASNDRNKDTISIECCIEDETGRFNDATYRSLVELTAFLMGKYNLTTDDVIRHYDVTGKICPKYFVDFPAAWDRFKEDVNDYIKKNGVTESEDNTDQGAG